MLIRSNFQTLDRSATLNYCHHSLTCFVDVMVTQGDVTQDNRAAWVGGVRKLNAAVC